MSQAERASAPVRTLALVVAFVLVLAVDWSALRELLRGDRGTAEATGVLVLTAAMVCAALLVIRRLRRRT